MSRPWTKVAVSLLSLAVASGAPLSAQQTASNTELTDQMCGQGQLSGQYECVISAPLSEDEVRVSLSYLAELRPQSDQTSAPSVIAAQLQAHRD